MTTTLLLGGAGAGKTTRLLGLVEAALQAGARPDEIAFLTFTRAAAHEARGRAMAKFGLEEKELPWFRTLHSLAFRALGWKREWIFGRGHREQLAELTGEEFNGEVNDEEGPVDLHGTKLAGQLLFLDQYARTTCCSLQAAWHAHGLDLDWRRAERFSAAYTQLRKDLLLYDFTDLLEEYLRVGTPLPVKLAIVDEAQDLTPLQWAVADRVFAGVPAVWVAGDDDQAVHHWAGAAPERLFEDRYDAIVTLPASHRLPRAVYAVAAGVLAQVRRRRGKPAAAAERPGRVDWLAAPDEADLSRGTWLLLARTGYQLRELVKLARAQGVAYSLRGNPSVDPKLLRAIRAYETLRGGRLSAVDEKDAALILLAAGVKMELPPRYYGLADLGGYGVRTDRLWHDAFTAVPLEEREYLLACLRRGERLTEAPRVRIETIHGAKGREADNVLLLTELTGRVARGYELDPDSEHRVFYVGVTRARERLCVVEGRGLLRYQI